jgi:DNA polymerase III subunit beta
MPVLENFLFEIKDGLLTVYATDLEISFKSSISVDASENLKIVIPAKLLFDIIKSLRETQLKIEAEKNSKLKITAENGVYYIGYSTADDFPAIPSVAKSRELVIKGMEFKKSNRPDILCDEQRGYASSYDRHIYWNSQTKD